MPDAWSLTTAGFQVPLIPFEEVFTKAGTVPPVQIFRLVPKLKAGVSFGVTVTENVTGVAHDPAAGVNV